MSQKSSSKNFYKSSFIKIKPSDHLKNSITLPELPAAHYLKLSDEKTIKTRVFSEFASLKLRSDKASQSQSRRFLDSKEIKDHSRPDQSLLLSTLGILNTSSTHSLPRDLSKLKGILSSSKSLEKLSLGPPATREDTTKLADWLSQMLKTALSESNQDMESLCETAMVIYEVCLYEIVRQVSVQCVERGELINSVWKAYQGILEKALQISKAMQEFQRNEFQQECEKIQLCYSSELSRLKQDNQLLSDDIETLRRLVKSREEECSNMARKELKIIDKVHVLQKQYETSKRDLLYLQEDNRIMKAKLFNSSVEFVENSQGVIEPRLVSIQKIRRKNDQEIQAIVKSDPLLSAQMVSDEKTENLMKNIEKYDEFTKELMNKIDFQDKNEATEVFLCDKEVQTEIFLIESLKNTSPAELMEFKVENIMDLFEGNQENSENDDDVKETAGDYLVKFKEKIDQVNEILEKVRNNIQKSTPAGYQREYLKTFFNSVQNSIDIMRYENENENENENEKENQAEDSSVVRKRPKLLTFIQKIEKSSKKETRDLIGLITQRVLNTPAHKLKSVVFKRMLMKLISTFYEIKQKKMQEGDRKQQMSQIASEFFLNKYGMQKVVENKFTQLLSSCLKYKSIKRVYNFGRFLNLFGPSKIEDLHFYMDSVSCMRQTFTTENGEELKIPQDKAIDWCKSFLPSILPEVDRVKVKTFIESNKQTDPITRVPTVEVDSLLDYTIEIIHKNRIENADFLRCIYEAGDVFFI
jgi:hypothetical protein